MTADTIKQQQLKHLNSIIKLFQNASIDEIDAYQIVTRAWSVVSKICSSDSPYSQAIDLIWRDESHIIYKAERIEGILLGLRGEIEDGLLDRLPELIRADLFDNFLAMSDYLLGEGYKDAAAVIAGSSLETHLRQMAVKNKIELQTNESNGKSRSKRADAINQELYKARVYSKLYQKQITTWLDLRNNAAHGNYSAYSDLQVGQFVEWLKDFIQKYPA